MVGDQRVARQVGAALRRLRHERDETQRPLARSAGISGAQLAAYEGGCEQPSVAALATLVRALGCSAEEFGKHLGPWGCLG